MRLKFKSIMWFVFNDYVWVMRYVIVGEVLVMVDGGFGI